MGGNERTGGADARRALLVCKCKEMPRNPMPLGYRDPRGGLQGGAVPCSPIGGACPYNQKERG